MEDKLKNDVETLIKSIFSEKEEVDMKKRTEEALQTSASTIDELTTALEGKSAEMTASEEKVVELDKAVAELKTKLEAAKSDTETATEKLVSAAAEVEKMHKDKAMEVRMAELETAGVVRKDKDTQSDKVREMSDDEFAAYKEELVSVRESVLAEIAEAKKTAEEKEAVEKAAADKAKEGASDEEVASSEEEGTPPANIDTAQAVSAAMNLEVFPSDDMVSKYDKLGKAMAEMFTTTE